ncbi:MAG: BrnT family toxin [Candidatus Adiutrix sp.]|nr:BrnT family toxin [Candidatus Adiutrix sp.]
MNFEWDENKCCQNLKKHGVDFGEAALVVASAPVILEDDRRDYGEPRYLAFGEMEGLLFVVSFTFREEAIRLISARRGNIRERKRYEERLRQKNNQFDSG